jgi:hypothetical protein
MELATVDKFGRVWRIHHNARIEDARHSVKDLKLTIAAIVETGDTVWERGKATGS